MDEAKEFLTQSGKDHCSGLQWSRDGKEKGTMCSVSMFCCAFKKASGCHYKCKIIRSYDTGSCEVQESKGVAHADHRIKLNTSLHKLIKAKFSEPGSNPESCMPRRDLRKIIQDLDLPDDSHFLSAQPISQGDAAGGREIWKLAMVARKLQ
jgi:hypothetical protein